MSNLAGAGVGYTSSAAILVLFILLVIITSAFAW
ncbi:YjcZ family sporulation protein [Paenibacillus hexagrammi]|uniref:YjcZ family sporulation protein n=1 Tax=Paenibacillus hexagrammi TaxID=2908839 RepID=A0ABY3SB66_9BACL|nr:YjcZ family sporulation protein [Paenibacillus sp. YPD9-1]UJF31233.1 YjcZ family sporulation protein [Paenibacillus sp. YPD9-1]UJF31234.1 YjcZ family sporulation protein [Paenibacillus sp. YPD9-1]